MGSYQGFVPIEKADGWNSFVDFRCLDHHNAYSHLPSALQTTKVFFRIFTGVETLVYRYLCRKLGESHFVLSHRTSGGTNFWAGRLGERIP
jgi:hypothetical protein